MPHLVLYTHQVLLACLCLSCLQPPSTNMSSQAGPVGPALAAPVLMEKIDRLFACNVGEYVSLPQLVVVGDQSSGKSSVLEGLTRLSFPRDSGLCTRFATQIIFRRDGKLTDREITASIIPAPDVEPGDDQRLRSWHSSGIQTLSHDGFTQMMKEVIVSLSF